MFQKPRVPQKVKKLLLPLIWIFQMRCQRKIRLFQIVQLIQIIWMPRVIEAFFKKCLIAHYNRMKPKFKNPKPYNVTLIYADFIFEDQNQRQWPSSEKLSPTFFGTSNFETWLSRDPITWHPEVRCFGYRMTNFMILLPQKNFSRTLQILGFIAESYQCSWHETSDQ